MKKINFSIYDPKKHLFSIFSSEDKKFRNGRAYYKIKWAQKKLYFEIFYKDERALESVKNSISSVEEIYNTILEMVNKNG